MALKFLHASDYEGIITTEELDVLTGEDPTKLANAERKAISKVKKFLLRKYKVDQLFAPVSDSVAGTDGDSRDETLVEYTIYFALYILFGRIAKRKVPDDRYEQYREAREFFKDIQQDMTTPDWPLKLDENGETLSPGIRMNSDEITTYDY